MTLRTSNSRDGELKMAVREQFAWLWLSALVLTYGVYFTTIAVWQARGEIPFLMEVVLLSAAALAQMIILGVGTLVARLRREPGARTKPDERDRAIKHRATTMGYYVLIAGMIVVGCIMPFSASGWEVAHVAVLAIVIAEIVTEALVVRAYQSGWHP